MRIIGGKYRSRKIKQPKLGSTRPTKDRIREAVFNVIAEKVPGSDVLDIFAGSGAYGLEALSRGAKSATFVENNKQAIRVLKENIRSLGAEAEKASRIIAEDALKAIEKLSASGKTFDIVFSDPPYNKELARKSLIMINRYDILKPLGFAVIEHHAQEGLPETAGGLSLLKQKTYGDIYISIFHKKVA